MGSEPLYVAYPFHKYKHTALLSFIPDVLLSTFKCTHFGFGPGIYLPDSKEQVQKEFFQKEYRADGPAN